MEKVSEGSYTLIPSQVPNLASAVSSVTCPRPLYLYLTYRNQPRRQLPIYCNVLPTAYLTVQPFQASFCFSPQAVAKLFRSYITLVRLRAQAVALSPPLQIHGLHTVFIVTAPRLFRYGVGWASSISLRHLYHPLLLVILFLRRCPSADIAKLLPSFSASYSPSSHMTIHSYGDLARSLPPLSIALKPTSSSSIARPYSSLEFYIP